VHPLLKLLFVPIAAMLPMPALAALSIFATVPEWGALAQEIGGSAVDVYVATNALQDPHHVEAKPSLIARARKADLVIATGAELEACQRLLEVLERRAAVLGLLHDALDPGRPVVRVGPELEGEELHGTSYVGATYGLPNRSLGAVGLLGPLRMDYEKAIRTVRAAAFELSRFVEDVYEDS